MIADASVLILFARAGHLDLLRRVFSTIEVPDAVAREVLGDSPVLPDAWLVKAAIEAGWIRERPVDGRSIGRMAEQHPNLGLGEMACLCLARAAGADAVLLDDAHARRIARLGIRPVGCLGVVARAYRARLVPDRHAVAAVVRGLVSSGLWVSADVVERFWDGLGGRP